MPHTLCVIPDARSAIRNPAARDSAHVTNTAHRHALLDSRFRGNDTMV